MSTTTTWEMSRLLERLRIQTRFRELKKNLGNDQALLLIEEALRIEFSLDRDKGLPVLDQTGSKKSPVAHQ